MSYDRRRVAAHPLLKIASQLGFESPWWSQGGFGHIGSQLRTDPTSIIGHGLLKKALDGGPMVHHASWGGNLIAPAAQVMATISKALKLRRIWTSGGSGGGRHLYANETTMVELQIYGKGRRAEAECLTVDPQMLKYANDLFGGILRHEDPSKGIVFTLASGPSGYHIRRVGVAGSPLERGNYSREVLAAYDHIVEDLNTDSPCGRLVVLAGEPGTGKTYLVRSLLACNPRAAFILVPPHLIASMSGPELLPTLISAKDEMSGPIALVIEDADQCLVPRDKTGNIRDSNMNAISSLLNLGDGILGSILDVRIIATTNAHEIQFDDAIMRDGRLCKHAHVGLLPAAVAAQALTRLTGKKLAFSKDVPLATVYKKARELGWKPPAQVKSASEDLPDVDLRPEILSEMPESPE
jgi:hypothetical protein